MKNKYYSPSINIVRDKDVDLNYIPTQNGEKAFNKIVLAYESGTRAFNIVGSYGSGKSSFLLALEKSLNNKENYYVNNVVDKKFKTEFFIGEYTSFKSSFCERFNLDLSLSLFEEFKKYIELNSNNGEGLLIIVDEFGKFLEYAAKENPEEELFFIQQLAEFVNSFEHDIIFISTLHQAFDDYALDLTKAQRSEWHKVKGRLIEISFNEPVEQLLFLVSERLKQNNYKCTISKSNQKKLFKEISDSNAFPLKDYFSIEFANSLFPFDILSASVITLAFQVYGQQERSMFNFIESDDYLGLSDFVGGNQYYSLANCFDYLIYNFHSLLNSRYNPHSTHWTAIKDALERTENSIDKDVIGALNIVKTIGLLSIFGRAGHSIAPEFILTYAKLSLNVQNPEKLIDLLVQNQIIRYQKFNKRYVLFKGTDVDINYELDLAENKISNDFSLMPHLQEHFSFPIMQAKQVYYEIGTPRYFTYLLTESPSNREPVDSIDGYINLIFNDQIDENKLVKFSEELNEPILFGWFLNTEELRQRIIEIEKIKLVRNRVKDDIVARNELDEHLRSEEEQLNNLISNSFYGVESQKIKWYFKGEHCYFRSSKDLNKQLSLICKQFYYSTPVFNNELINRERVSGAISTARKKLITQIIENNESKNLGFEENKYPPEYSIYLSLLKETGIHQVSDNKWIIDEPTDKSFIPLWNLCEDFLDSCNVAKRKLEDLINLLKQKPIKLKQGFIDFWVPLFLISKQDKFTFFENDIFIPQLTVDTIDVAMRQPQKYYISTFKLDKTKLNIFNRYRYFLNQIEEDGFSTKTFVETIKPFLLFYNRLVPYTKQTKSISKDSSRLRDAIAYATNPEKIFFEDIPRALGYTINDLKNDDKLEEFTIKLRGATQELSGAYESLVNRVEDVFNHTLGELSLSFPENKLLFQKRFEKVTKTSLSPKLKVLLQRINTPLEDRKSWINSIASVVMNKTLDKFNDNDEEAFLLRFPQLIHELDNFTEISEDEIDKTKEDVMKLEITSFVKGVQKNLIRIPKHKSNEITKLANKIKPLLKDGDSQSNIVLLINLLQEQLKDD